MFGILNLTIRLNMLSQGFKLDRKKEEKEIKVVTEKLPTELFSSEKVERKLKKSAANRLVLTKIYMNCI